jgi:hypothetical protein
LPDRPVTAPDRYGVVYIARGPQAVNEARLSIMGLRERNDVDVSVIGEAVEGARRIPFADHSHGARWSKVNLDQLTPYAHTLYLDADTRPQGDITVGFDLLQAGWDVVMTASDAQGNDWLWHVADDEREATLSAVGYAALQLQCGVLWFARNERVGRLFAAWRAEWQRWQGEDQGAFLRALAQVPVKVWLVGRCWNGGAMIQHRFGAVRHGGD